MPENIEKIITGLRDRLERYPLTNNLLTPEATRSLLDGIEQLHEALTIARAEVDRWGYGDFHYATTPRDPSVLNVLGICDHALASVFPQKESDD